MQPKYYSIVKHLEKMPAQISVLALLLSLQHHQQALSKALEEAYVPARTSIENLAAMIGNIVGKHRISFSDEELLFEGAMHNKVMHITIICQDYTVNQVLIDNGSSVNICPLSTLVLMGYDLGKNHQSHINVSAFDGGQRDTI